MPTRQRHPKKEVETTLRWAEALGLQVEVRNHGHTWGRLLFAQGTPDEASWWIRSTPRVPGDHAAQLRRAVERAQRQAEDRQATTSDDPSTHVSPRS